MRRPAGTGKRWGGFRSAGEKRKNGSQKDWRAARTEGKVGLTEGKNDSDHFKKQEARKPLAEGRKGEETDDYGKGEKGTKESAAMGVRWKTSGGTSLPGRPRHLGSSSSVGEKMDGEEKATHSRGAN